MNRHKHPGKPHKRKEGQYIGLPYTMINRPSFKALKPDAVRILIEMHLGFHGVNNGKIGFSYQKAQECLHSGSARAKRAFNQLQEHGFLVCLAQSSFNMKTKKAREWEITLQPMPNGPPSHKWKKIK